MRIQARYLRLCHQFLFPILFLACALFVLSGTPLFAKEGKKIVLIAGPITGHPKHTHEYEKNVILLKHLLDTSPDLHGVTVEAHFYGWPSKPETLDDADTIVLISDGGDHQEADHPFYVDDRLAVIEKQMKRGCGLIQFHWSTFHPSRFHQQITEWVGGYFDYQTGSAPNKWFSAIQTWEGPTTLGTPDHPISRGVNPFRVQEEFYYRIRFRENDSRVKPIVMTVPPNESNPYAVGWAVEREDGGRGFGFTGGHFYRNWWNADFRKMVVNAIAWTAKCEVPQQGIRTELEEPIRVLIATGYHSPHHDWRGATSALIQVLEQDPRVFIDVSEEIEDLAKPTLFDYDTIVFNYNNWDRDGLSEEAKNNFRKYLENGGGLSVVHFANGAFTDTLPNTKGDWEEFRTKIVRRVWVHGDGRSSHDAFGPFRVELSDIKHEITAGLQPFATKDELYFKQEGPLPIEPVMVARSQVTGELEPMAWAYAYGKGRVFQTVLGHAPESIQMAGALIRRGTVWTSVNKNISFDPPVELTAKYLWRDQSSWTPEQSLKRANIQPAQPPMPPQPTVNTKPQVEGRFGQGLNAAGGGAVVAANPKYCSPTITVEAQVRIQSKDGFNIIAASETKSSRTHWEMYSYAGSGFFSVYMPGVSPGEFRTSVDICDGKWHHVGMILEEKKVRLYVDGKLVKEAAIERPQQAPTGEGFAIGRLVEGGIGCDGTIDDLHIRVGAHEPNGIDKPAESTEESIGLWNFDELKEKSFPDQSKSKNGAMIGLAIPPAGVQAQVASSSNKPDKPKITGHWGEDTIGFRWTEEDSVDGRWQATDKGPFLAATYSIPNGAILKGLAIRVGEAGDAGLCFDTGSLRFVGGWRGDFVQIDPARYGLIRHPQLGGSLIWQNEAAAGWNTKNFRYRGMYQNRERTVLNYEVENVPIRDAPWASTSEHGTVFLRDLEVDSHNQPLLHLLATSQNNWQTIEGHANFALTLAPSADEANPLVTIVGVVPQKGTNREKLGQFHFGEATPKILSFQFSANTERQLCKVLYWTGPQKSLLDVLKSLESESPKSPLAEPSEDRLWKIEPETIGKIGASKGSFRVDTIQLPFDNPYKALMFVSGHDFFADGRVALCTVHGDVWIAHGIDEGLRKIKWVRFATGLYQPLGLKIVDGQIYVLGKDQITRLHDRNQNGEADYYENFNNFGVTSIGTHDYVTCLETDSKGNFYYLRANTGVERVSADGKGPEILATGLRNPNGLGIGPKDEITAAPQEGEWTPASNIAVVHEGNHFGYLGPKVTPERPLGYDPPLVWLPRLLDNSCGGQTWLTHPSWGPLQNLMVHLSFGRCWPMIVLRDAENPQQGAVVKLPLDFDSGICRGRVSPLDGHLYLSGLKGWASSSALDGCLQRIVRLPEVEVVQPIGYACYKNGILLTFATPLERMTAENPDNWSAQIWNYRYSAEYGSPDLKVSNPSIPGHDDVDVLSATLQSDHRSVFLELKENQPVGQMAIRYSLRTEQGLSWSDTLYTTIHTLANPKYEPSEEARNRKRRLLTDAEAARLKRGLIHRFQQTGLDGTLKQDERVGRIAAQSVSAQAPTPLIEAREYRLQWEGYLNTDTPMLTQFALVGAELADLVINDQRVVLLDRSAPEHANLLTSLVAPESRQGTKLFSSVFQPIELNKGLNRFRMTIEISDLSPGSLKLLWTGGEFGWETISPERWKYDPANQQLKEKSHLRMGASTIENRQCVRCHADSLQFATSSSVGGSESLPDLASLTSRVKKDWLGDWLLSPASQRADSTMPSLFDASSKEDRQAVADIVEYLVSQAPQRAESMAEIREGQVEQGRALFEAIGCAACHVTEPVADDPWKRLSLQHVSKKFYPAALADFLKEPTRHYQSIRMPTFDLSEEERLALVALLMSVNEVAEEAVKGEGPLKKSEDVLPRGDSKRGEILFSQIGCRSCHSIGTIESTPQSIAIQNWSNGCLAPTATRVESSKTTTTMKEPRTPRYLLTAEEIASIQAIGLSWKERNWHASIDESAQRKVERLNCVGCHGRDGEPGHLSVILQEEGTQGFALEFLPDLTWTGEKLKGDWIEKFLEEPREERLRPWTRARMPRFVNHGEALVHGLRTSHGESDWSSASAAEPANNERLQIGQSLVRANGGLDCRQCHAIGDQPIDGDQKSIISFGVNFSHVNDRLNYSYYRRWMHDPLRIDPLTKMPKYKVDSKSTKVTTILDGDAEAQFDAIWEYLRSLKREGKNATDGS